MNPLRILIVGSAGQLGTELKRSFAGLGSIIAADRKSANLAVEEEVRALVARAEPDIILNAAAYTAVDKAEAEPELAMAINAEAPRILAEEAVQRNALLIHYSTDYVFDGGKSSPWVESDPPAPLNEYGRSKLAGEEGIRAAGGRWLIFRTSWVYGPHGHNFLLTMLRLGRERDQLRIVDDQIGAPTTSMALADATRAVVDRILAAEPADSESAPGRSAWPGVYHMTCGGQVSWCGFAQAIFARAQPLLGGKMPEVAPIPSSAYPTPAARPRNSVLNCDKLEAAFGVRLPNWEAALDPVIARLATGS